MSKCRNRKFRLELSFILFNEGLPHQSSCCIIWKREINGLIKELFDFSFRRFIRFTRAAYYSNSGSIIYEFGSPFRQSLLYSGWILRIIELLLFFSFLTFFFCWPNPFCLINVNYRRLILFGYNHN